MKTDQLIAALAADAGPERELGTVLLLQLLPALAASVLFLLAGPGLREDLGQALQSPVSSMRLVLSLVLGLLALRLGLALAQPGCVRRGQARIIAVIPLVAAGLWLWTARATPPGGLGMAIQGKTIGLCLFFIPLLASLPTLAILMSLRRGASMAPRRSAIAAGLAGGGFGAAIYALHCTEDSPLFYVTWYGVAILAVTLVSGVFGARLLRW